MKDNVFGVLQCVGRSFMLPIAILPVAGLLLGVGGSFTNETMLNTYGLMGIMGPGTALNAILQVMSKAGDIVFSNLPIIFAMGVAALHNKFYKIELPKVLSFFGGTRFVPIVSGLTFVAVGIVMFYVWPVIQQGIYAVGGVVLASGYAGTWVYGLMERALIPFGLHHVFYLPFWQTALGGTLEVNGVLAEGAQNIFFAQLADPGVEHFAVSATRFMSGKFPLMIFGLPGAALAMYRTAKPEKKQSVSGLLLSAALTFMLTGITEPLEFTFLIKRIDLKTPGRDDSEEVKLYRRADVEARKSGTNNTETTAVSEKDSLSESICNGLGGKKNISDVDCCATRLRCTVHDAGLVNDEMLKSTGASGVVHKGNGVQIIYGPRVTVIKSNLEDYLEKAPNELYHGNSAETEEKTETVPLAAEKEEQKPVESIIISSPMDGIAADLSETPDDAFAEKMMGDGAVVTPQDPVVRAPEDGEVCSIHRHSGDLHRT